MLFNSLEFLIFIAAFFPVYCLLPFRARNLGTLLASYFFYACWDARFVALLAASTLIAYSCSLGIHRAAEKNRPVLKRTLLTLSIGADLGILLYFKYWNFFLRSLGLSGFGELILPIGISFYTFHSIGYCIDVYRGTTVPPKRLVDYALFVSFFPLLVAGPIERSAHLLPQILKPRTLSFEAIEKGIYRILLGLFQKMVIADHLAPFVDSVYSRPHATSLAILTATYAFAIQIYCDFAGYSNIAIGVSKCMGFEILENFGHPYFSSNPTEFWHRWHISLSSWLRDYLYIPLGGNRGGKVERARNLLLTMLLGGLWHGANWTFILWGTFHGVLLLLHKEIAQRFHWRIPKAISAFLTFQLICLGWLFFRAKSLTHVGSLLSSLVHWPELPAFVTSNTAGASLLVYIAVLVWGALEYSEWRTEEGYALARLPRWAQASITLTLFYSVLIYGVANAKAFLYFQF